MGFGVSRCDCGLKPFSAFSSTRVLHHHKILHEPQAGDPAAHRHGGDPSGPRSSGSSLQARRSIPLNATSITGRRSEVLIATPGAVAGVNVPAMTAGTAFASFTSAPPRVSGPGRVPGRGPIAGSRKQNCRSLRVSFGLSATPAFGAKAYSPPSWNCRWRDSQLTGMHVGPTPFPSAHPARARPDQNPASRCAAFWPPTARQKQSRCKPIDSGSIAAYDASHHRQS